MQKKSIYRITGLIFIAVVALFLTLQNLKKTAPVIDYSSDPRCQTQNAKYRNPSLNVSERVDDLTNRMTEPEKIGQLALVEKNSIHNADDISRYNLGGLLSGFGGKPDPNTPEAWLKMVSSFQSTTKNTCLQIPILYGVDAIHGFSNVVGATIFPHFIGLGASHNPELVRQIAQATTEETAATGIYWSFAPNIDVVQDHRWGRTFESFGSDTANVSKLGLAYMEGVQTTNQGFLQGVATLKHYVGAGGMEWGSSNNTNFKIDQGNVNIDQLRLRQEHLEPFKQAIEGGAQIVMVGLNSINEVKMSESKYLITDVLKKELNFSGMVVSDWYGVYEISKNQYASTVVAVNSGVDMIMLPFDYQDFEADMKKAISRGDITQDRLDEAVSKILTVKFNLGLFDRPVPTDEGLSIIGNQHHRDLAREAVRKSQVLLKNENHVLPLSKSVRNIIIAGSGADNLGRQSGGWTIEWQGIDGNWIPGTTILSGIKNTVSSTTKVDYDLSANFPPREDLADVGIAVVSEKPYAEGWGDNENPTIDQNDLDALKKLRAQSKTLIVLIISGRPLNISSYINDWDGVVASWLPGSEGQGVSDVLFGLYPFTATLPIQWDY